MITNLTNAKVYVGQTWNVSGRQRVHFSKLCNNSHFNIHLQRAYNQDPTEFGFSLLEWNIQTQEELDRMEDYWFQKTECLNPEFGYNMKDAGSNGKPNDEVKRRLSELARGRVFTDEHRRNLSKAHKGKIIPLEQRAKMNEARKGYKWSDESRRKLSETKKGKPFSGIRGDRKGSVASESTRRKQSESMKRRWQTYRLERMKDMYNCEPEVEKGNVECQ